MVKTAAAKAKTRAPERGREEIQREQEILHKLAARDECNAFVGGVAAEERRDGAGGPSETWMHIGDPFKPEQGFVTLPTRLSAEKVEELRDRVIWTKEFCELFHEIAKAYQSRLMLLLEGESSIGKTLGVELLTELLYGRGIKPEDFYCQKQTEASEMWGKWVPKLENRAEQQRLMDLLQSDAFRAKYQAANACSPGQAVELEQRLSGLALDLGLAQNQSWEYQLGAVPRAYIMKLGPDGRRIVDETDPGPGMILHIQELGLARNTVQNALLALGGEGGRLGRRNPVNFRV